MDSYRRAVLRYRTSTNRAQSREEAAGHRASWVVLVTTSPTFLLILCQPPGNTFSLTHGVPALKATQLPEKSTSAWTAPCPYSALGTARERHTQYVSSKNTRRRSFSATEYLIIFTLYRSAVENTWGSSFKGTVPINKHNKARDNSCIRSFPSLEVKLEVKWELLLGCVSGSWVYLELTHSGEYKSV